MLYQEAYLENIDIHSNFKSSHKTINAVLSVSHICAHDYHFYDLTVLETKRFIDIIYY